MRKREVRRVRVEVGEVETGSEGENRDTCVQAEERAKTEKTKKWERQNEGREEVERKGGEGKKHTATGAHVMAAVNGGRVACSNSPIVFRVRSIPITVTTVSSTSLNSNLWRGNDRKWRFDGKLLRADVAEWKPKQRDTPVCTHTNIWCN